MFKIMGLLGKLKEPIGETTGGPIGGAAGGPISGATGGPIGGAAGGPIGGAAGGPIGGAEGGPIGNQLVEQSEEACLLCELDGSFVEPAVSGGIVRYHGGASNASNRLLTY